MKKENHTLGKDVSSLKNRIWFILNILFTCVYLIWRLFFTIPFEFGVVSVVAGLSLFLVEFLGMLEALIHYFNMYHVEAYPLPEIPVHSYPEVDVFIATYNEPRELLFKTINGCLHMNYPDKSKVHIYICDDGRRPEIRGLAEKLGVGYLDREDNKNAKAGNLNNALKLTKSPYIVTLDADMIPHREFLMHTVPYFIAKEMENKGKEEKDQKHIGFVQTPQAFYNPDLFQFNLYSEGRIPNEQDYFYRDIQVSRNRSNSVIYGGSNTVISRKALEDIGGFYTGTITEDYATGILIQEQGYLCYATDEVLASGLSPTDLKSLLNQRIRWARGVIATNRKVHVFLSRKLSFSQKVNYWASEWYWFAPLKRLIYFLSPILYAVFGYMVIKCTLWQILLFWLPMYITSNVSLRMLSRNIRTTKWTSVYETVLFPYLLVPVILETFGITMKQFKVTQKGAIENEKGKNLLYLIPFVLLIVLSAVGIFNCIRIIFESNDMGPVVVLFWLIINLFTLVMAMFFILGRNYMRQSERALIEADCQLETDGFQYDCKTSDISESGVALFFSEPVNLDDEKEATLRLSDGRYEACIKARVVHVDNKKNKWKYAFRITDYCGTLEEYLQIVYDRVPTLPQNLNPSSGSFEDLRINVARRAAKPFYENRRLPRIYMKAEVKDKDGHIQHMMDFNYKYCSLQKEDNPGDKLTLIINEEENLFIHCVYEKALPEGRGLYKVTNYRELYENPVKRRALEQWVKEEWLQRQQSEELERKEKEATEEPAKEFDEMDHV